MGERRGLLLDLVRTMARHSRLRGHELSDVINDTVTCLATATGSSEISFATVPLEGEDLLVVHEIRLLAALEDAGLTVHHAEPTDPASSQASHPPVTPGVVIDAEGVATVGLRGASGLLGALRVAPRPGGWDGDSIDFLEAVVDELSATMRRHWIEQQHLDRTEALLEAQRHTHVGCFEWDVVADKVRWSDELFRIYGNEPQSFEPTFEEFLERIHEDDRESVRESVFRAYEERSDYRIEERILRPDGSERLLSSWGHVITDESHVPVKILGSCQDVTELRATLNELTETERRLVAVEERRRQALELNDNVMQGLATATYALELGHTSMARHALDGTLQAARSIISDLLSGGGELNHADLVRTTPSRSFLGATAEPSTGDNGDGGGGRTRVVVADDSDDLRLLVSLILTAEPDFEVVGTAANGIEAVALTASRQPDVVLLDLAMPLLDGLDAIPQIQAASPDTAIAVFSGFSATSAAGDAINHGAHAYIEKGLAEVSLVERLREIHVERLAARRASAPGEH